MEPVAIVGIGCKFPGADTPEELWSLLENGKDMVTEVPNDRWNKDNWYSETKMKSKSVYIYKYIFNNFDLFNLYLDK